MKKIIFALPGNEMLARRLAKRLKAPLGKLEVRRFPDEETYVRVRSKVSGKEAVLVCALHKPDEKIMALYFLAKNLKDLGAKKITLLAPYLAYMRQDKKFKSGEALSSVYFARFLSSFMDELITFDPHLHRRHNLSEIYGISTRVLHASGLIADYIGKKIKKPVLIGPDIESKQWVSEIAAASGAPYLVLRKKRLGDKKVRITAPEIKKFKQHAPVLIDDIVSTAQTMIVTLGHLKKAGLKAPVCIGVHAVFSGNSYKELKKAGAARIITCNTIHHASNKIDISELLAETISRKT